MRESIWGLLPCFGRLLSLLRVIDHDISSDITIYRHRGSRHVFPSPMGKLHVFSDHSKFFYLKRPNTAVETRITCNNSQTETFHKHCKPPPRNQIPCKTHYSTGMDTDPPTLLGHASHTHTHTHTHSLSLSLSEREREREKKRECERVFWIDAAEWSPKLAKQQCPKPHNKSHCKGVISIIKITHSYY